MDSVKNLIFIEDDELDFEVYSSIIHKEFPHINVEKTLSIDETFKQRFKPAETLILLDLNLDGKSGFDVFEKDLKMEDYLTCIHTSSDNPSDIEQANELGAYAYFQKKTGRKEIQKQFQIIIEFYSLNLLKSLSH